MNLSIREWICPSCQTTHDRDENPSRNLRAEGKEYFQQIRYNISSFQLVPEVVRLVGTCTKKRVSKKQEPPATA